MYQWGTRAIDKYCENFLLKSIEIKFLNHITVYLLCNYVYRHRLNILVCIYIVKYIVYLIYDIGYSNKKIREITN